MSAVATWRDRVAQPRHDRAVADQGALAAVPGGGCAAAGCRAPAAASPAPCGRAAIRWSAANGLVRKSKAPSFSAAIAIGTSRMAGDQDHRDFGIDRADAREELEPVHARHADVRDEDAAEPGVDPGERALAVAISRDVDPGQLQRLDVGLAQLGVVVDEADALAVDEEAHARLRMMRKAVPPSADGVEIEVAAELAGDVAGDAEPEAEPVRLAGHERREQLIGDRGRNAGAIVVDLDNDLRPHR